MTIPTNDDGMFEVVDENGNVVGHGVIVGGTVDFSYADTSQPSAVMSVDEFEARWAVLPQARLATLRAAA